MDLDDGQDLFDENDIGEELLNDTAIEEEERPKSIRFAEVIATPFDELPFPMNFSNSEGSLGLYEDFAQPKSLDAESEGSVDLGIHDPSMMEDDDNDEDLETEESDTKRNAIWAASGAGALALLGWGARHVLSLFQKGGEEDDVAAAAHPLGEGAHAQNAATIPVGDPGASLSASTANASQSQSFFAAGVLPGDGGTGMTAMQYV
jgi:hypothetical protein